MSNKQDNYREQALKLYPWVCGHCARAFDGKNLRELTVHHKDHNHDNNPADGSNWELLCIYCHDHEHSKYGDMQYHGNTTAKKEAVSSTYNPFADLQKLLDKQTKG